VLTELMRPADYHRMVALGGRLADGIESAARARGLDWRAHRFGGTRDSPTRAQISMSTWAF